MKLKKLLLVLLIVLSATIRCGGGDNDCMPIDEIFGDCQSESLPAGERDQ